MENSIIMHINFCYKEKKTLTKFYFNLTLIVIYYILEYIRYTIFVMHLGDSPETFIGSIAPGYLKMFVHFKSIQ